jgi:sigma-B regulation protein RsbU (phosphoserine phosphatase)
MKHFTPKSLQQRFAAFILFPVAVLIIGMGTIGFIYARNALLEQWGEAALLKLERAAHQIDMRLSKPKDWLATLHETAAMAQLDPSRNLIVQQLKATPGVVRVSVTAGTAVEGLAPLKVRQPLAGSQSQAMGMHGHMRTRHMDGLAITPPIYDSETESPTVSMLSDLNDENGQPVGRIDVVLSFGYLMGAIVPSSWWQSEKAFLVDDQGRILTAATHTKRKQLGETGNALELATLAALKGTSSGTVIGTGHPPDEVSGFYRLKEAPWHLVLFAPGQTVLSPIIQFRLYYFITVTFFVLFILVLIRWVTGRTTDSIKEITFATRNVARGTYDEPLIARTRDEVGELITNFNAMTLQLEERVRLKQSLRLAEDVQKNLLPVAPPSVPGMDIAGIGEFCEEIGGDYYDYLDRRHISPDTIGVVVGDVSGHGIPSALLMATVRAVIRQRMSLPGSLSRALSDVNRQLADDVEDSGRFATLFYLDVDNRKKEIRWVRAGHDPAFIYDTNSDTVQELGGKGLPLGVTDTADYEESHRAVSAGQIIIVGTDGIWETRNPEGQLFGKPAFINVIKANKHLPAKAITAAVLSEVKQFCSPLEPEDDITLVVIKIES